MAGRRSYRASTAEIAYSQANQSSFSRVSFTGDLHRDTPGHLSRYAPSDWGSVTPAMKRELRSLPAGSLVLEAKLVKDVHVLRDVRQKDGSIRHDDYWTTVAYVTQASVSPKTGKLKVSRLINGGVDDGVDDGLVKGDGGVEPRSGNVVKAMYIGKPSDRHKKDWGCEVFDTHADGSVRKKVLYHKGGLRPNGATGACYSSYSSDTNTMYEQLHEARDYHATKTKRLPAVRMESYIIERQERRLHNRHHDKPHRRQHMLVESNEQIKGQDEQQQTARSLAENFRQQYNFDPNTPRDARTVASAEQPTKENGVA